MSAEWIVWVSVWCTLLLVAIIHLCAVAETEEPPRTFVAIGTAVLVLGAVLFVHAMWVVR